MRATSRDERWRAVRIMPAGGEIAAVLAAGCAVVLGSARRSADDELARLEGLDDDDRSPEQLYSRLAVGQFLKYDRWSAQARPPQVRLAKRLVLDGWGAGEAVALATMLESGDGRPG